MFDGQQKEIIDFPRDAINKKTFRYDYNELVELTHILIDNEFYDISFKKPGTVISCFLFPSFHSLIKHLSEWSNKIIVKNAIGALMVFYVTRSFDSTWIFDGSLR